MLEDNSTLVTTQWMQKINFEELIKNEFCLHLINKIHFGIIAPAF
jgi:hypothetical protein